MSYGKTNQHAECSAAVIALRLVAIEAIFASMPTRTPSRTSSPPAWIKPELAALVKAAPEGTDWLHEMKLDGYRMHDR
jgi:ATP-dependent DNA ligase